MTAIFSSQLSHDQYLTTILFTTYLTTYTISFVTTTLLRYDVFTTFMISI